MGGGLLKEERWIARTPPASAVPADPVNAALPQKTPTWENGRPDARSTATFEWRLGTSAPFPAISSLIHPELPLRVPSPESVSSPAGGAVKPSSIPYSELTLIGQFHATYLLCESDGRLIVIDQHAAHERIGFELLKKTHADPAARCEPLLVPLYFDLLPSDAAVLEPHLKDLEALGIDISAMGGPTFALHAAPSLLKEANWNELIGDLIDDLRDFGTTSALSEHIDDLLATMACHRQIRAHQRLSTEEMRALLHQLGEIDFAYHCPHGRPAAVEVPLAEFEKWFKRRV